MLTSTEHRLFLALISYICRDSNNCPEVGMGPFPRQIVERACSAANITLDEETKKHYASLITIKDGYLRVI